MKPNKLPIAIGLITLGLFCAPQSSHAEMASDTVLLNTCYSCHGTDGKSAGDMPTIAGKSKKYIADSLKAFRSSKKTSTVMMRIAKGFNDAELNAIASAFSKQMGRK